MWMEKKEPITDAHSDRVLTPSRLVIQPLTSDYEPNSAA